MTTTWTMTTDVLLEFAGLHGSRGLCHVRIYEAPGQRPVALVGQLDEYTGTSITNAAEAVAGAIAQQLLTDGREFRYIEHYPSRMFDEGTPSFDEVFFKHISPGEQPSHPGHYSGTTMILDDDGSGVVLRGDAVPGTFREPDWIPLGDIASELPGATVKVWPSGEYTAANVAGVAGQALLEEVRRHNEIQTQSLLSLLDDGPGER